MVGAGSGASGGRDLSRIIAKSEHSMDEIDFKKGVRKPKTHGPAEQEVEGATEDSIAGFVEATKAAKASRNAAAAKPGFLKRLFGRR